MYLFDLVKYDFIPFLSSAMKIWANQSVYFPFFIRRPYVWLLHSRNKNWHSFTWIDWHSSCSHYSIESVQCSTPRDLFAHYLSRNPFNNNSLHHQEVPYSSYQELPSSLRTPSSRTPYDNKSFNLEAMSSSGVNEEIGSTLTGRIQDISAILLLLGTEQCSVQDQVGSALTRGYLYAAATPMSIFGSPVVVRAGFKTLVTCFYFVGIEGAILGIWDSSREERTFRYL